MLKRYIIYLIRWQISTPVIAFCFMLFLDRFGTVLTTVLANLVGGLIFFWIDIFIFKPSKQTRVVSNKD